jgi:hypothetical protein
MDETGELPENTVLNPAHRVQFALHPKGKVERMVGYVAETNGPAKAFETELPNTLWMADIMDGPTLRIEERVLRTFLFATLDDCSRLVPHASAIEEVPLLTCARTDTRPSFSLLLIGDDSLLARLQMGIHRGLLSRLGFCLCLRPLDPAQSRDYIAARLRAAAIRANPFEDNALELLIQAADGLPRAINHLAQRALEEAACAASASISAAHVQNALDQLPWLTAITL